MIRYSFGIASRLILPTFYFEIEEYVKDEELRYERMGSCYRGGVDGEKKSA